MVALAAFRNQIRESSQILKSLAQARAGLGEWGAAVCAARCGQELSAAGARAEFVALLDRLALAAAQAGSYAGFDGRTLEVPTAACGLQATLSMAVALHLAAQHFPQYHDSWQAC